MKQTPFVAIALTGVLICSCSSSAGDRAARRACDISDLSAVFRDPLAYAGHVFCGKAYFYKGQRIFGFYDKPVDSSSLPGVKHPILLPGNVRPQELQLLETGDEVAIRGILRPDEFCFQAENRCTPFNKPIDIDELVIEPLESPGT